MQGPSCKSPIPNKKWVFCWVVQHTSFVQQTSFFLSEIRYAASVHVWCLKYGSWTKDSWYAQARAVGLLCKLWGGASLSNSPPHPWGSSLRHLFFSSLSTRPHFNAHFVNWDWTKLAPQWYNKNSPAHQTVEKPSQTTISMSNHNKHGCCSK